MEKSSSKLPKVIGVLSVIAGVIIALLMLDLVTHADTGGLFVPIDTSLDFEIWVMALMFNVGFLVQPLAAAGLIFSGTSLFIGSGSRKLYYVIAAVSFVLSQIFGYHLSLAILRILICGSGPCPT